jgi:outer membrane immunogenic protein
MMVSLMVRTSVALLFLVAAAGAGPARAQNYDGDGVVRVGLFAQGTWLDVKQTLPTSGSADLSGFSGGISAGYDFLRTSRWVLGFEADASLGDLADTVGFASYGFDYLATLRGRAGFYLHPNWLIYGTAGAAWIGFEAQSTLTGDKASETVTGWTAGGGTEVDRDHVIYFAEYLYTDFGSRNSVIDATTHRADLDGHQFRIGLKFKVGHDYFRDHDVLRPLK